MLILKIMLKGNKVKLIAIEKSDLPLLMEWRNKPEYRKYFREYRELNDALQNKWYENQVINDPATIMYSIKNMDDELIGCCGLAYINWVQRNADLSLYIGWKNCYIDDEGFAEESTILLLKYAFNELNLHKIWTEIYEFDSKKLKLYKKLNFKIDAQLRDNYFYDGKYWDSYILSILSNELK